MNAGLRSRLWWSYILVAGAALLIVAVVLLVYIVQNPSTYRQANARLTVVTAILRKNEPGLSNLGPAALQARLEQFDSNYDTRVVLYDRRRQVIADSRAASQAAIEMPPLPRLKANSVVRDQGGRRWLYVLERMVDGRWLMTAVPRPVVPLLAALGDEFMLPVLGAAAVALVVSLLAAFWLARWIGEPLQHLAAATRNLPSAKAISITPGGPREVQQLARAFNDMNGRTAAAQKSQREFVANVSHELKTPLTSIQGFSQALLDGTADTPESRQQAARIIHEEAGRMHRMVLDLLELARLDAGTLDLEHAAMDIPALLKNIGERFGPQAQAAGVTLQVLTGPLPEVTGDGDRLAQMFSNLVDNAIKNTPTGGSITLKAAQEGAEIQVDVIDTGSGISPEALPHIFERFYQADPARAGGKKHGTGLGLAIAKEIVAAHGGKIGVRSTQPSDPNGAGASGSVFTVTIPIRTPEIIESKPTRKT